METVRRAECLFGSLSFVSSSRIIAWQQRFILSRQRIVYRQMSAHRDTHTRNMYGNFPNSSLPTTNNSCSSHKTLALSCGDGWRSWRSVIVTPFILFFKLSGKCDNEIFHIATCKSTSPPNLKHFLLCWSPFPLWKVQYGYYEIFLCLPSEMFALIHEQFFSSHTFFWASKAIGGFHFLAGIFI